MTARQPTGRVVTVSNRKTFTDPVFNYSAHFDWIWEELRLAVPFDADWRRADALLLEEISEHDPELRRRGEEALAELADRYLISRAEIEPQTFVRMDEHAIELTGRFVTGVRTARSAKDAITRRLLGRLEEEGIPTAWTHPLELSDGSAGQPPLSSENAGHARTRSGR